MRWEGCPEQREIAAGTGQNKLPASYYPPSGPLLCPFESFNLYPRRLSHSRNGFVPGVITANDCTIFIYFYPRPISRKLPISETCARLSSDVATRGSFICSANIDCPPHPVFGCHCIIRHLFSASFWSFSLTNLNPDLRMTCTSENAVLGLFFSLWQIRSSRGHLMTAAPSG